MKYSIVLIPFLLLGCSPTLMNDGTAVAFKACLDKGWQAEYFSNGAKIQFDCLPPKTNILKLEPK